MKLSDDPQLVVLFGDLEAAVLGRDFHRMIQIIARMNVRLQLLARDGLQIPEGIESLFADLSASMLDDIESIGTLDDPGITRKTGRFSAAPSAEAGEPAATVSPQDDRVIRLWFGTNRKETTNGDLTQRFSSESAAKVTYGSIDVFVPESHRFGETGNSFLRRLVRLEWRNDNLRIQDIQTLAGEEFWKRISEQIISGEDRSDALVFIHGFNNTFAQTAVRAAQIAFDMQFPGPVAFFSWPSKGAGRHYVADGTTIERSEPHIEQFLVDFVTKSQARKVHVICHSMGNRGYLASMERIALKASLRDVTLGQVILAAPDVDRETFVTLTTAMKGLAQGVTLYASDGDKAVWFSSGLNDAPRAGYYDPVTCGPHFETITVPDWDIDFLGHGYFAESEIVMKDMHCLLTEKGPRPARSKKMSNGQPFWELNAAT